MAYIIQASVLLATTTEANQDKLLGYPLAGLHVGGGRHVSMPPTWDGNGAVPIGWTSYKGSTRQHPTLPQYATPIDPESTPAMANGRRNRLNAGEQTKMAADLAAAVASLPGDWLPGVAEQGVKAETGRT